jgi:hypothetical protein
MTHTQNNYYEFPPNVWIGLVNVKPNPGNKLLGKAVGAFVPAIALAKDERDFANKVAAFIAAYDFDIIGIDDIEHLETRRKRCPVEEDVLKLADGLSPGNDIAISTFDSYREE